MIRPSIAVLVAGLLFFAAGGAAAQSVLKRGNGGEPKSLDPHYTDLVLESNIIGDLLVGLTTEDAEGNAIPGAAERWTVSPDGKTWTFHLRDHVWSDSVPVTAQDFLFAWQRILNPKMAAPYAYQLWVIKNAKAVSEGKVPVTSLGATARDARTLVVELEHPAPYLPELLTHIAAYPVPRHVVEAKGSAWARPTNYVTNGPYVVSEWIPNDHVTLKKNPKFFDARNVRIDEVIYYPTNDAVAAIKWIRGGLIDTQDPFPSQLIDWLRPNMPRALQMQPYHSVYYLNFNIRRKPFQDARVREAFNLAFDRETLTNKIIRLGEPAAYSIVPPKMANYPVGAAMAFKDMSYAERVNRAQALMRAAGFGPRSRLKIRYATTTNADSKRTAAAFQSMLRQIYVDAEIVQSEVQVHYKKLEMGEFDLAYANWVSDFNDATNFLDLLRCGNGDNWGNNYAHYCNRAYDALLDQANNQPDLKKRGALLRQAEDIALGDYAWLPIRFANTLDIVQPYVKGWIPNARDINRSRWLSIERETAQR
ncbi:MAG: peptide ABC transporter substrate-binding protein [Alphaproteobacteria bacterium]